MSVPIDVRPIAEALQAVNDGRVGLDDSALAAPMAEVAEQNGQRCADSLVANVHRLIEDTATFEHQFERRLAKLWNPALARYDLLRTLAREFGEAVHGDEIPDDVVATALTRLHARGCLVASEIGALLRTGHASGANARWRTLHELSVVAFVIAEHGRDLATRYLEHGTIDAHKAAAQLSDYAEVFGEDAPTPGQLVELQGKVDDLVTKYGPAYKGEYGWAADALGLGRVTFAQLAASVRMDTWAPYVRMASLSIHTNVRASLFDLGAPTDDVVLMAGPSHLGLADPGANAAVALAQLTVVRLLHQLDGDWRGELEEDFVNRLMLLIKAQTILALADDAAAEFVSLHRRLDAGGPYRRSAPPPIWTEHELADAR